MMYVQRLRGEEKGNGDQVLQMEQSLVSTTGEPTEGPDPFAQEKFSAPTSMKLLVLQDIP